MHTYADEHRSLHHFPNQCSVVGLTKTELGSEHQGNTPSPLLWCHQMWFLHCIMHCSILCALCLDAILCLHTSLQICTFVSLQLQGEMFFFMEHVAARRSTWAYRLQCFLTPATRIIFSYCHVNREGWRNIEQAGFAHVEYRRIYKPLWIFQLRYCITGIATKWLVHGGLR